MQDTRGSWLTDAGEEKFVSDRTQAIFGCLVASGVNLGNLLALVSSAYADGGNHVLDQLQAKIER